jgi:hypothetical protein
VDVASLRPPANEEPLRSDQLRGALDVGFDAVPGALRTEDIAGYVARARENNRVKSLLGARNAFIQTLSATDPKRGNADPHHLRLVFYSHTHSRAVEVVVHRGTVRSAQNIRLWPPEGKEEIAQAIELAKHDPRLAGRVADLQAGGMVAQPTENTAYLNHRVMDIRFYDESLVSRYFATVDLTDLKVHAAGAVQ